MPTPSSSFILHPSSLGHLVPERVVDRERLRSLAGEAAGGLDRAIPPSLDALAAAGRKWLESLGMPAVWLGFAMVCLNNAFWANAFAGVPAKRRLLLLPHCLAHPDKCSASVNALGLHCGDCGSCGISALQAEAEAMGYQVVVAEGTGQLLERLSSGMADAILGVACMDSLSKSYPRLAELGVPNLAVPLIRDGCRNTQMDHGHLLDLMRLHREGDEPRGRLQTYVPLLRQTRMIFEAPLFDTLMEPMVPPAGSASPMLGETDRVAMDCLRHGGKRLRPFSVLAAFAVSKAGDEALCAEADLAGLIGPAQRRVAIAIEAMHRASLVHDDIEDHDDFRNGRPTLHQQYGTPAAINVGDHLIGVGYRLVAAGQEVFGASAVADMMGVLARAHMELSRGQGAELFWRDRPGAAYTAGDTLKLYSLKTSPAFESALYCGLRMAEATFDAEALRSYCMYLGIAFQIANDLDDWRVDTANKGMRGRDVLAGGPTLLHALAMESAGREGVAAVMERRGRMADELWLQEVEAVYVEQKVFDRARQMLKRMVERSCELAERAGSAPLGRLLGSLVRLSVPAGIEQQ